MSVDKRVDVLTDASLHYDEHLFYRFVPTMIARLKKVSTLLSAVGEEIRKLIIALPEHVAGALLVIIDGVDVDVEVLADVHVDMDAEVNVGAEADVDAEMDVGAGVDVDAKVDVDPEVDVHAEVDVMSISTEHVAGALLVIIDGVDVDVEVLADVHVDMDAEVTVGAEVDVDAEMDVGAGVDVDAKVDVDPEVDVHAKVDVMVK
ncbi:hypothetical protein AWC38_SpisGene13407 [Stylophora pistillata]|uniref:Uncharacterized protein n=1 Tax=Stylophora pistillata TaxID=50429 RepID=A0A2B4RZ73_STYPI|nr:hypothetical protein AWC38_SpisGene13407 [Stylophora pistillata]